MFFVQFLGISLLSIYEKWLRHFRHFANYSQLARTTLFTCGEKRFTTSHICFASFILFYSFLFKMCLLEETFKIDVHFSSMNMPSSLQEHMSCYFTRNTLLGHSIQYNFSFNTFNLKYQFKIQVKNFHTSVSEHSNKLWKEGTNI
jgi:hypothetical protein